VGEPFIRIRDLHQKLGSVPILRGIDLDVMRGETLVLLGVSGAGKSVLLKHLPGLMLPDSGSVQIDGVEIAGMSERDLTPMRRKVGIMFQGGALFDFMTVGENVAFPLREAGVRDPEELETRVAAALDIVRLGGEQAKMPAELSGGMRKRVALARAVVGRPACVLYDEPHAGLDPVTGDSIDHMIKCLQYEHGMTNVVITHEMRSVFRTADRIAFLREGRVDWLGSPAEFQRTREPHLRAFLDGDSGEAWREPGANDRGLAHPSPPAQDPPR
jgi:phospholipid/cholesterol/gamma-HCH transport system ATP-binding protein